MTDSLWIPVGPLDAIPMDEIVPFAAGDQAWVLIRTLEGLAVFIDVCSHQDVKLSDFGEIQKGVLICHAHGAAFRCDTGEELCFPATAPLFKAPFKIEEGLVSIRRPDAI